MTSISYQNYSQFTFLSDTLRTVRIVFRTVNLDDMVKKGITKTKTEALGHTSRWRKHHLTPACAVSRQAEPPRRSLERRRRPNKQKQSLGSRGRRSWRPQFDLGWACSGLPLNAGWDFHQAAGGTWSRSMRKREHSSGQKTP